MADFEVLRSKLEAVGESLADAAIEELREALAAGRSGRVDRERKLTQARRAVAKAVNLLEQLDAAAEDAPVNISHDDT